MINFDRVRKTVKNTNTVYSYRFMKRTQIDESCVKMCVLGTQRGKSIIHIASLFFTLRYNVKKLLYKPEKYINLPTVCTLYIIFCLLLFQQRSWKLRFGFLFYIFFYSRCKLKSDSKQVYATRQKSIINVN